MISDKGLVSPHVSSHSHFTAKYGSKVFQLSGEMLFPCLFFHVVFLWFYDLQVCLGPHMFPTFAYAVQNHWHGTHSRSQFSLQDGALAPRRPRSGRTGWPSMGFRRSWSGTDRCGLPCMTLAHGLGPWANQLSPIVGLYPPPPPLKSEL